MRMPLRSVGVSLSCLVFLFSGGVGRLSAADAPESKRVHFSTFDDVELTGTFYPSQPAAGNKDKDCVVILLHDFKGLTGGGSRQDGWIQLAGKLQKEGYTVLSFDFRGFGDSKAVGAKFWQMPFNRNSIRGGRPGKSSIDQKDFTNGYYITLVNDVAAARGFLDAENDAGNVNSSNIILVGAGQGATVGALWLASELRRQRDNRSANLLGNQRPQFLQLDDPEGADVRAAVWLTVSPSLENVGVGTALRLSLVDAAKTARIPTFFLHSKEDEAAINLATNHLKAILADKEQKGAKKKEVAAGKLTGSKLLGGRLRTGDYIVDFLNKALEDNGSRVRKQRQAEKYAFCWSLPWPTSPRVHKLPAKLPGQALSGAIPPAAMNKR